jgi:hypothetical protein
MAGLAAVGLLPLIPACSSRAQINPGLQLSSSQIEKAKTRAKSLIRSGADPYSAYGSLMHEVNVRVSAEVILRKAAACWPQQELAFQIAQQEDDTDAGLQRAADEAVRRLGRELKFMATVEMPVGSDPAGITFAMRTHPGNTEYPPISVSTPFHLRDYTSALDPTAPPASLWAYDIWFPIAGSPGYPAIDESVRSVCLVVKQGESQAEAWFDLPRATMTSGI